MKEYHLFIIPGLGDPTGPVEWLTKNFSKKYGIVLHIKSFGFMTKGSFDSKLHSLNEFIKPFAKDTNKVITLMGISAGASAVVNSWSYLSDHGMISKRGFISVCGRLRKGKEEQAKPSLEISAKESPPFYDSVIKAEKILKKLYLKKKENILTFRGLVDEAVPISTSTIEGAANIRVPMIGHLLTIGTVLQFYQKTIATFCKTE